MVKELLLITVQHIQKNQTLVFLWMNGKHFMILNLVREEYLVVSLHRNKLRRMAEEMQTNRKELLGLCADKDAVWIAAGLTPITPIATIPWVPKGRYEIMKKYLPKRGDLAAYMMKGTCSVQANFDFSSEADCARKSGSQSLKMAHFAFVIGIAVIAFYKVNRVFKAANLN